MSFKKQQSSTAASRITNKLKDDASVCIFCSKPVDAKNHFVLEQTGSRVDLQENKVCGSPFCLSQLISSKEIKSEYESESDSDDGFRGFAYEENSKTVWVKLDFICTICIL